jgi:hypothetical protein
MWRLWVNANTYEFFCCRMVAMNSGEPDLPLHRLRLLDYAGTLARSLSTDNQKK